MKKVAVAYNECGTEIHIEMDASETLLTLKEKHPQYWVRCYKEDLEEWQLSEGEVNDNYNPQEGW